MIVITAPTGAIGSQVLARLLDGPEPIRVVARDPSKLPAGTRRRVEVVAGSHSEADVVRRAFEGADSLFWLVPGDPAADSAHAAYVGFSKAATEALAGGSIRRVIAISALGRGWPTDAGHVTATLQADDLMSATGVAYRALACGSLMENILRQAQLIIEQGVFRWPSPGDRKMTAVATRDVAAQAARLLQAPSWTGVDEVPLKGPEAISFDEMAETMTEVLGRPVRFQEITMADMRAAMIGRGASQGMADAMVAMLTAKNRGLDDMAGGPTPSLTPTTFAAWCRDVLRSAVRR